MMRLMLTLFALLSVLAAGTSATRAAGVSSPPPVILLMAPPSMDIDKPVLIEGSISGADYPLAARQRREAGMVQVRYLIGSDGKVLACEVIGSSGSKILDDATCPFVLSRFRYKPATSKDGKTRWGFEMSQRIRWELPSIDNASELYPPSDVETSFIVNASGLIEYCEVIGLQKNESKEDYCPIDTMLPFVENGKPVARRVKIVQRITVDSVPSTIGVAKRR